MRCLTLIVVVVVRLNLHLGFFEFGIKLDYIRLSMVVQY